MCILFISRNKNSNWPLLIATNRDEFYNRDFDDPGFYWEGKKTIFAGKDKKAGGSWLGVNKYGLCIAILNRKTIINETNKLESRGNLVINALKFKNANDAKNKILENFKKRYRFFNLFISDVKNAFLVKYDNFKLETFQIPFGKSILDNGNLNDKNSLRQTLNKSCFYIASYPVPEKRQFDGWIKLLLKTSPNIKGKITSIYVKDRHNNYGTVCSSIIGLPKIKTNSKDIFWLYRKSNESTKTFKRLKLFS